MALKDSRVSKKVTLNRQFHENSIWNFDWKIWNMLAVDNSFSIKKITQILMTEQLSLSIFFSMRVSFLVFNFLFV